MDRGELLSVAGLGLCALACCSLLPARVAFVSAAGLAVVLGDGPELVVAGGVPGAPLVVARRRRDRDLYLLRRGGS